MYYGYFGCFRWIYYDNDEFVYDGKHDQRDRDKE